MSQYDLHTEEDLKKHAAKSEELADQYRKACEDFAEAKLALDKKVVEAIKTEKVRESAAYEKILPMIASESPDNQADYDIYVKMQQLIKGLEQVLATREKTLTLHQSLMKNRAAQKV